jgi:hypothetical protein
MQYPSSFTHTHTPTTKRENCEICVVLCGSRLEVCAITYFGKLPIISFINFMVYILISLLVLWVDRIYSYVLMTYFKPFKFIFSGIGHITSSPNNEPRF